MKPHGKHLRRFKGRGTNALIKIIDPKTLTVSSIFMITFVIANTDI
jgi:hypothetical protein